MKFIDWFAGIGGFRRGLELAGHKCVGFCEYDNYAVASYTAMHLITKEQAHYLKSLPLKQRQKEILKSEYRNGEWYAKDISEVKGSEIPKADIWTGGSHVRIFQSQDTKKDLRENVQAYFSNLLDSLKSKKKKISPNGLSLRMLRISYQLMMDGILPKFCLRWEKLGIMSDGKCLTQKITEFPKTGNVCILSDILEEEVDEKYFLSKEQVEKIVFQ